MVFLGGGGAGVGERIGKVRAYKPYPISAILLHLTRLAVTLLLQHENVHA